MKLSAHTLITAAATILLAQPGLAALGGAAGVVIPYSGKLELNGVLATGSFDFQFQVMVDATTSTACDTKVVSAVAVTNGELALSIPAVNEACVKGKDVHLIVSVRSAGGSTFTVLGKQRVTPTLSALTSGTGDFNIGGQVVATNATVAGTLSAGSVVTSSLNATGSVQGTNYVVADGGKMTLGQQGLELTLEARDSDRRLVFSSFEAIKIPQVSLDGNQGQPVSIHARGSVVTGTTPDLAETIASATNVEAADVVCADPAKAEHVVRCPVGASGVLGVISDGTSSFLINSHANAINVPLTGQPLVLAGRVPVKVSRENGGVHIGDELALSSTPGVAMRATGTGPVIGIALADFDLPTSGTVLCFVHVAEGNAAALAREAAETKQRLAKLEARLAALEDSSKQAAR